MQVCPPLSSTFILDFVLEQTCIPSYFCSFFFFFLGSRYAKVNESLTSCKIGAKITMSLYEDDIPLDSIKDASPFCGQIGPVYLLNDAISPDQVQGIYSLGPSYMYLFLDNEAVPSSGTLVPSGILDVKDGLASKIIFGINAQVLLLLPLFPGRLLSCFNS